MERRGAGLPVSRRQVSAWSNSRLPAMETWSVLAENTVPAQSAQSDSMACGDLLASTRRDSSPVFPRRFHSLALPLLHQPRSDVEGAAGRHRCKRLPLSPRTNSGRGEAGPRALDGGPWGPSRGDHWNALISLTANTGSAYFLFINSHRRFWQTTGWWGLLQCSAEPGQPGRLPERTRLREDRGTGCKRSPRRSRT